MNNFVHTLNSYLLYFLINIFICNAYAHAETKNNNQPPSIGNFALPFSQQPGAFVSFGQNTLEKGKTQIYIYGDDYEGDQQSYIDLMPSIVYGISDKLSAYLAFPYAASYRLENHHSSGISDVLLQLEYIFYSKENRIYSDTATLVLNTTFPTGSTTKNPPTGYGAQTYFLGATYSRMFTDWLIFLSPGYLATTSHHGTKLGNNFLYEFGLGKNISYKKSQYILSWLLELNGTYYGKDKINGTTEPNSGGNIIYAVPSIWFSTQHLIFQSGIGWAIAQKWNSSQRRSTYLLAANIGWTF
jgi:hypothetical protein